MPELKPWQRLPEAGAVRADEVDVMRTGGWRTGTRPEVDLVACVNCLLCWLYCPDSAIQLEGTTFAGFDLDVCKGCELCEAVCPVGAIRMVPDED